MAVKNAAYWKERAAALTEGTHRAADASIREIEGYYREAQRELEALTEKWYGRIAANNGVSIAEARRLLSKKELAEFRWDARQYIKAGEENGITADWARQLENASARYHISRLDALNTGVRHQIEMLHGRQERAVRALMGEITAEAYSRTMFDAQKGIGIGWDTTGLRQEKIDRLLATPWTTDGKTFSDRIWADKDALIGNARKIILQGMVSGSGLREMTDRLSKAMGSSRYAAGRLIHTESTYFQAEASREVYRELDCDRVECLGTLDKDTCEVCGAMDGQVVPMTQYEPGVTVPPFHPNCRCTTIPWVGEADEERIARDHDGESYVVPGDMCYREWKEAHPEDAIRSGRVGFSGDKELFGRYSEVLKENAPKTLEEFRRIKYNDPDAWEDLKAQYRTVNRYRIDTGHVSTDEILRLDWVAFETSRKGFDISSVSGKVKKNIKSITKGGGNSAAMVYDGKTYFGHSRITEDTDVPAGVYIGEYPLVLPPSIRRFSTIVFEDYDGAYCCEAKFFEFIAKQRHNRPHEPFSVTILSEKHICPSCQRVHAQFLNDFKNAQVNIVSGNPEYGEKTKKGERGKKTWEHRKNPR